VADRFQVKFGEGATDADDEFYQLVTSVEVEENADLPGAFQLTLPIATEGSSGSEDLTALGDDRWKPYARVAVVVTPDGGSDSCIFDGYVLAHKIHVERSTAESTLRVWGQDVSCLMNLKEEVKVWKARDGAIANEIFDRYSFAKDGDNDDKDLPEHPESGHVLMQRATDAQFLRDRARRNGKLFRVCCNDAAGQNTGYFITPKLDASADVQLVLNPPDDANVESLDFEWDVARPTHAYAQVLLAKKDPQKVDTEASGLKALDSRSLAAFIDDDKRVMQARLTTTADSAEELKQRAASLLREAGWFVRCEGEADLARLNKVLRVAHVVEVAGAGNLHSGKYLVWSVRHTITAESHRMKFVLVRNAVGASVTRNP
jgi:phage protein D